MIVRGSVTNLNKYYKVEKRMVSSTNRDIKILIIKPKKNVKPTKQTPDILWLHGGGYVTGMAEMILMSRAIALVKNMEQLLLLLIIS